MTYMICIIYDIAVSLPSENQTRKWTSPHLLMIFPAINLHFLGISQLAMFNQRIVYHSNDLHQEMLEIQSYPIQLPSSELRKM